MADIGAEASDSCFDGLVFERAEFTGQVEKLESFIEGDVEYALLFS